MTDLGPPADLDPGEAWMRMTELPRPVSEPQALRARGAVVAAVRFWPPTAREVATANVRARRAQPDGGDALLWNTQLLRIVARDALRPSLPLFRRESEVGALTPEEIGAALLQYAEFRASCGPVLGRLSHAEFERWVEFLKRGAEQFYVEAARWGCSNSPHGVAGVDPDHLCDCHVLCWTAARRVIYPDEGKQQPRAQAR